MKYFLSKNKKIIIPLILVLGFVFIFPHTTYAAGEAVAKTLGWMLYPFIALFGKLAILFLDMLIGIAQYSNFIHSSAVNYGWKVVRDLCNMFFVLILLIISFATILRVESYNLKTWLPKLVIMAVLINFSKLICGLFIDFSQVIMLTFINAIKDIAGANLTEMLGISKILTASKGKEVGFMSIIGSMILALIMVVIATVVILTVMVMLAMRIIMIWIYVVLSPLAYLLAAFPQGKQYSERWWSDFSKNIIIGPIIAFFLWLAFASLGGLNSKADIADMKKNEEFADQVVESENASTSEIAATMTEAGSKDNMILFVVSIGMLLGGMMIAQEVGGMAGKVVGSGMGKLQALGAGAIKYGKRATFIERGENAWKARQQRKESKRTELAQRDAGKLLGAEKAVKSTIAKPFQAMNNGIASVFKGRAGVSDEKIKEKEEALKKREEQKEKLGGKREKLSTDLNLIKDNKNKLIDIEGEIKLISDLEAERNGKELAYNNRISALPIGDPARTALTKERDDTVAGYNSKIADREKSVVDDFNRVTGQTRRTRADVAANIITAKADKDVEIVNKNKSIKNKDREIRKNSRDLEAGYTDLAESKKKSEKISKWSAIATGAISTVAGFALGGPAGAAIAATGAATGFGRTRLQHAGNDALDLASNYNSSEINKHKEKRKEETDDELRRGMNDYSRSSHERTADAMLLMERGKLSTEEAKVKTTEISGAYGSDNRVLNQLDSTLNSFYQQLNRTFQDLKFGTPDKQEAAKRKIVGGIITGDIKMHGIDDQESLNLIMPKLAEKMTPTNFKNMFNSQTTEKRDKIKLALTAASKNNNSPANIKKGVQDKAGDQLVNIKSTLDPLPTDDRKNKYLSNAGMDQIKSIADTAEGLKSIAELFKKDATLLKYAQTKNLEEFRRSVNKKTQKAQFKASQGDSALLMQIMNAIKS